MSKRCVDKIAWIAVVGIWSSAAGSLLTQHCYYLCALVVVLAVLAWLRLAVMERNDDKRLQMYKDMYEHFSKRYYEKVGHERSSRTK